MSTVKTFEEALRLIQKYEENGPAKLYYSVNRKSWEIAQLMNNINMESLSLEDAKDKTFDRLKGLLKDASEIAVTVKALGDLGGITGSEEANVRKKRPITPEFMT